MLTLTLSVICQPRYQPGLDPSAYLDPDPDTDTDTDPDTDTDTDYDALPHRGGTDTNSISDDINRNTKPSTISCRC